MDKPIVARITDVKLQEVGPVYYEPVIVQYYVGRTLHEEVFESPLLNEENLQVWRRLVLGSILNETIFESDSRAIMPNDYKNALIGKDAYIGIDEGIVFAIGCDVKKLFFPDMYGLFNVENEVTAKSADKSAGAQAAKPAEEDAADGK